tara:strand:- start:2208 stop:3866 length:1659 start_codon:yes stop_codon:yes gene_type:complete
MSYTSYVASNPDLKKAFEKSGAKSAASWGKSHWEKHGSKEGRAKTPHNTKKSSGGGGGGGSSGGGGGGTSGGSYAAYVKKYPDLKKHYDEVVKKTGASMEAWGEKHWHKHGSGEGRTMGGGGGKTVLSKATSGGVLSVPPTFKRTRGGYDPDTSVDYTNTNPAYWNSVVSYFKGKPGGNPKTGELGIWIPNLEKEGAERTALAAIAGGVTAHVDSNYSNRTVDDATAKSLGHAATDRHGRPSLYRGGAEKAIRLAGTHRGGVLTDTGYAMGSTAPTEHGVHIKGGVVTKGAGADYVKGGGDFGGLLGLGDAITGDWLTGVLGGMDKDGMRIGGTYPAVRGATGSGVGAGGTKTSVGGLYAGGVDPFASMPAVADYTPYMDPNSMFGGLSDNESVKSGLLYQPTASNYGERMEAAGMPAFSPGLLSSFSPAGAPTYGATPGSFMKPAAGGAAGGGGSVIGAAGTRYLWPEYLKGDAKSKYPVLSKHAPKFATKSVLFDKYGGGDPYTSFLKAHPSSGGFARVMDTGRVYRTGAGAEYIDEGGWLTGKAYPAKT